MVTGDIICEVIEEKMEENYTRKFYMGKPISNILLTPVDRMEIVVNQT